MNAQSNKIVVSYRGNNEALDAYARNGAVVSTHSATTRGMINALKSLDEANKQAKDNYGYQAFAYIEFNGVKLRADDADLNTPTYVEKWVQGDRETVEAPRYSVKNAENAMALFQN